VHYEDSLGEDSSSYSYMQTDIIAIDSAQRRFPDMDRRTLLNMT
jgi:hypothetical protein